MPRSLKKRKKIIESEIIDEKWNYIYLEKQIRKVIQNRYKHGEIKLNSSYIYQKMSVLLDKKNYLEARMMPKWYVVPSWYINVFDLHKKLGEIIKLYHLPNKDSKIYTEEERKYIRDTKL